MGMKIRSIKYYIKEGFRNLIKNRLMSVASIAAVMFSVFMVIVAVCLSANISYILEDVENSIGISAFVEDDLELEQMTELLKRIENIEHVTQVTYISADDALKIMKEELGEDGDVLDIYENDNPFSASFSIMVDKAENQEYVVMRLEEIEQIRKVNHALTITNILISIGNLIRGISIVIIAILVIVSVVIITNTIKLAVYIRKTEIGIMKYVGATDWFIRWPFVIEGTLIGLIGAIIPAFLSMFGYNVLIEKVYEKFSLIQQLGIQFMPSGDIFTNLFPLSVVVGIIIGTLGSGVSVKKYLKV